MAFVPVPNSRRRSAVLALTLAASALTAGCSGPAERIFTYSTDGASRTGLLALPDGDVVVGNESGALLRLSTRGTPRWRVTLPREVAARPVLVGDLVVAITGGGTAVGLTADSGAERWRVPGLSPSITPLAGNGTDAFVLGIDGSVRAINALTGSTRWNRPPPTLPGKYPRRFPEPHVSGDRLVVALEEAGVWSLSTTDGAPAWKAPSLNAVDVAVDRGRVLVAERSGRLTALDEKTGAVLWSRELKAEVTGGLSSVGTWLTVGLSPRALGILDVGSGVVSQVVELAGPVVAPPARVGRLLLVPTAGASGVLAAVQPGEGVVFEAREDSPLKATPAVNGDRVTVLASDGRVISLKVKAAH